MPLQLPGTGRGALGSPALTAKPRRPGLDRRVAGAVLIGGVGGGLARYALTTAWTTAPDAFPWPTFVVNTVGAFALALLLVVLAGLAAQHRYLRPLLGSGFLGAFTTFSSVVTTVDELVAHGHPRTGALYLSASLVAAVVATATGVLLGRVVVLRRRRGVRFAKNREA